MPKKILLSLFLSLGLVFTAYGQDAYILGGLSVTVQGWTSEAALVRKLEYRAGRTFADRFLLDAYLADLRRKLSNIRSIAEYELKDTEEALPDSPQVKVNLSLQVKDSWNIIALPYPKYDTNTGLTLSLKARDFNFLGTLEPLKVNLDFRRDQNERISFLVDTEFLIPFSLGASELAWYFYQASDIRLEKPWGWLGITRLSTSREVAANLKSTLAAEETLKINELDADGNIPYGVRFIHGLSYSLGYKLLPEFWGFKDPTYTPRIFMEAHNSPEQGGQRMFLDAALGFDHSLRMGRIDWKGNLRSGASVAINQRFAYKIYDILWDRETSAEIQYHIPFRWEWWNAGVSLRAGGWWTGEGPKTNAGNLLRGIVDRRIDSALGAYVNLEAPFTVLLWKPVEWFGWSWAKFSGFEMMLSPTLDLALADAKGWALGSEDFWVGGGGEVLVFSDFIRSFFVRASLAYDLRAVLENRSLSQPSKLDGEDVREISIGLGFFY